MNTKRLFAWILILLIPTLFIISIVLSVTDHHFAEEFLGIAIVGSVVLPGIFFLITALPKHIAEASMNITDAVNKHEIKEKESESK